jgi:hypothetical protein
MTNCRAQDDYASYLLRLWRSEWNGQPTWRASLESTRDGQRLEFTNLEALIAFLIARFGSNSGSVAGKEANERDSESNF